MTHDEEENYKTADHESTKTSKQANQATAAKKAKKEKRKKKKTYIKLSLQFENLEAHNKRRIETCTRDNPAPPP